MPTYGLTATGFLAKTLEVLLDEMEEDERVAFGPSIPLGSKTLLGVLNGIVAERWADLWELAEAVNSSQNPDGAADAALDALCLLTGTFRAGATRSTVTLTLAGTPATLVPAGSIVATTATTDHNFTTDEDATIATLTSWVIDTAYVVGDRRTNASRCYECITAGASDSSGGPTTTDADITDNDAHWMYLGEGTGAVDVEAHSAEYGEITGAAYDISVIKTPVGGWSAVTNLLDADEGYVGDTDEALRVRRETELTTAGTSTPDAIRTALLQVSGITAATVFYNDTDTTDGDGVPPHSIEALITGAGGGTEDQLVWNCLLANVAAGIGTYGVETGTALDAEDVEHTMNFTRTTAIPVYVDITVTYDADEYPTDGDAQIETAITDYGDAQLAGKDAVAASIAAQAFEVDGVLNVTAIAISTATIEAPTTWTALTAYSTAGTPDVVINEGRVYRCITSGTTAASGGPSSTSADITDGSAHWAYLGATIAVSTRQLATFDSSRIAVHSSAATP